MLIPPSLFTIGQPVIGTWDTRGTSLGVVYGKAWNPRPLLKEKGFWRYYVRKINGDTYYEMEELLNGAVLTKMALLARTKCVVNNERISA